ncbi:MAG: Gfo/Idh/MocA family oxidoreductase [Acidobacteria bacterium]|nr:Gfo/Idh/MocA family oxidoreductase [Acidobacteriota bacterium]
MNLPDGITYHPRQHLHSDPEQRVLIARNCPALIRIETTERFPNNRNYEIESQSFENSLARFLRGDWEQFDREFGFNRHHEVCVHAIHGRVDFPADPQLPDIWVARNVAVILERSEVYSFGCTMGHYYPYDREEGYRVAEVFEFQGYGLLLLSRENSEVEMWVAQEGDKIAVPTGCHATLYNLSSDDSPLIALSFHHTPQSQPLNDQTLICDHGPILLSYYSSQEVVFKLNRSYVNNPYHRAGITLKDSPLNDEARTIRVNRGARLDMGRMLYEQLTQNPALVSRFARLGICVKPASPEAVLEPLKPETSGKLEDVRGARLHFSLPLANSAKKGTDVYRYFIPEATVIEPDPLKLLLLGSVEDEFRMPDRNKKAGKRQPLRRPLMIVVEGVGDWVINTYRRRFEEIMKTEKRQHRLSVFYTDDSRWYRTEEQRQKVQSWAAGLNEWEVYLDKASPEDYAKYQKLRPDVVFVVTPDFTHSLLARQWLNKVPLVFVEKPFDSQVGNVDDLRRAFKPKTRTEVLGLDHYQFYALEIKELLPEIRRHLGGAIARIEFYLTEDRPIEIGRDKALQYGLTLDLLPHMLALLTYFGDVTTIDDITVVETGRYQPLIATSKDYPKVSSVEDISHTYESETYSRVRFTFQDRSHSGLHIPCLAVVGKGFGSEAKYMELTGINRHVIRIDLKSKPENGVRGYPYDSIFFLQGNASLAPELVAKDVQDPYQERKLKIVNDPANSNRFRPRKLRRQRYRELLLDLLNGTTTAVHSTLTLSQGQSIVRALDRIWWAIRIAKPEWKDFPLESAQSPFKLVGNSRLGTLTSPSVRRRSCNEDSGLILPSRAFGSITVIDESEGDDRPKEPVLTRGTHRHALQTQSGCQKISSNELANLLDKLRAQVGGLPISMLAHNWKSNVTFEFLSKVMPLLIRDDVVWLVLPDFSPDNSLRVGAEEKIRNRGHSIEIDESKEIDLRIHKNLITDLLFFPALAKEEVDQIAKYKARSQVIVIDELGPFHDPLQQKAMDLGLIVYCWKQPPQLQSEMSLPVVNGVNPLLETVDPLEEIGRSLAEIAGQLENIANRRLAFRSRLLEVIDSNPRRATWAEDLAGQSRLWPPWAVECLPRFYIPLEKLNEQTQRILVWNELLKWLPHFAIKQEAESEMVEEEVSDEIATLLEMFSSALAKNLRKQVITTDRSFNFRVYESMREIEEHLKLSWPEYVTHFKQSRQDYLNKLLASHD